MKEPNVLEAIDLCMNGNPCERPFFSDSEVYRNVCLFQPTSSAFQELSNAFRKLGRFTWPQPSFEKGTHVRRPSGNALNSQELKLNLAYSNEYAPKGVVMNPDHVNAIRMKPNFNCLSGNYNDSIGKRVTLGDFKNKSWFDNWRTVGNYKHEIWLYKFKKWLYYWFTPLGPEIDMWEKQLKPFDINKAILELSKHIKCKERRKKRYSISTPITRAWQK